MNLRLKSRSIDLREPKIMGILNLTEDSFYDGGRYIQPDKYLKQAETLLAEGADIIDIGACSTRPGSLPVGPEKEIQQISDAISTIKKIFPNAVLSVDTFRSEVAEKALELGAEIINDISSGKFDEDIMEVAAKFGVPYIMMHMQGEPNTMQKEPNYEDVTGEILSFFQERIDTAHHKGVDQIILDPGFGFGKTLEHNFQLLNELHLFSQFNLPVLVGLSRKSMLQKVAGTNADGALNATTAAHMLALQNGANILRCHDVKEAKQAVQIFIFTKSKIKAPWNS